MKWLFSTMCGINLTCENHFTVAPQSGGHFTYAAASYKSVFGLIESSWEKKDGKTVYTVTITANCEAEIILPGGRKETLGAGKHILQEE
ncbi:MAG: hypothetical protein J6V48_02540 [Clostridia bacterium]|nr:hypothetical protein [Clostridia bacterium]